MFMNVFAPNRRASRNLTHEGASTRQKELVGYANDVIVELNEVESNEHDAEC